ncbi:transposase, partial [Chryseobacterium sp. HMWF035]
DPRDISIIYFYDPVLNDYFEIPYRDTSKPPISIWEFNEVVTKLQKSNLPVDEDSIFEAYKEMDEIEMKAIRETKRLKRFSRLSDKRNEEIHSNTKTTLHKSEFLQESIDIKSIQPFDEIDDEAFTS